MSIDFYAGHFTKPDMIEPVDDASVNMGERNVTILFDALGIIANSTVGHMEIDKFLSIAYGWLQDNAANPQLKIQSRMDMGLTEAIVVDLGLRVAYVIERLYSIQRMLQNGKQQGATHVYWG